MPDVSGITLAVAIRAVDGELQRLMQDLATATDAEAADIQELILSNEKAAADLQRAYVEVLKTTSNLPRYADLVKASR